VDKGKGRENGDNLHCWRKWTAMAEILFVSLLFSLFVCDIEETEGKKKRGKREREKARRTQKLGESSKNG